MSDIKQMKITKEIIRALLFTPGPKGRWGLPALFHGPPGIGKTSEIEAPSTVAGLRVFTKIASICEPPDFLGMPMPHKTSADTVEVAYGPPSWAGRAARDGSAVVFFDEINWAPPAVQAGLLRVIFDGVVGDLQLPPGVRFLAACNDVSDTGGGNDLIPPLANRFGHFDWPAPSADDWATWMVSTDAVKEYTGAAELEKWVLKEWSLEKARAVGMITAFIRANPTKLLMKPNPADPAASRAWPSPRTWTMATHAYAGAVLHGLDQREREVFVSAFVGQGAANELFSYTEKLDLPNLEALLDEKIKWKHDPKRLDITAAVTNGCVALLGGMNVDDPKRLDRADVLYRVLLGVCDAGAPDLAMTAATAMMNRMSLGMPQLAPRYMTADNDRQRVEDNPARAMLKRLAPLMAMVNKGA